jgi:hypothetical protein
LNLSGNTLVIAHNRPPTLPWPNPWSHLLPTFSYSKETKIIAVTFYADPSISGQWPRPEEEWKDKEYVVAARPTTVVQVPRFNEIARWVLNSRFVRWTSRGGDKWEANAWNGMGVEEYTRIEGLGDTERIQWELEQV